MACAECEDLSRRYAVATDRYLQADRQRKAYVAGDPISGRDIIELAHLDQEVENSKRKRDDLAKEYARHRREAHPKAVQAEGHSALMLWGLVNYAMATLPIMNLYRKEGDTSRGVDEQISSTIPPNERRTRG